MRPRRALLFAPALGALLLAGCGEAPPERANVLLITVDTLRPDRLSCYGYRRNETPHIDRLAEQGALFERAVTDTPWTTPSMASVLTGVYPTLHGFKSTNANRLGDEQTTLAEVLRQRGYATGAVVGSFPLDSIYRLDQGFETYDDAFTTPIWRHPDHRPESLPSEFRESPEDQAMFVMAKALNDSRRTDAEVSDAALAWLEQAREPFFLWVHYFGPHSKPDWRVPEAERDRRHLAGYDPDVRENDAQVGRLLSALDAAGRTGSTLVVFHADHGESLGEQGYLGHGQLLNQATMRVPLLLRLPGVVAAGLRVERLVRNIDIFPTVLDVTGGPIEAELSGASLLPLVRPAPLRWWTAVGGERVAYMETYYPAHAAFARRVVLPDGGQARLGMVRRAVRDGRWMLERTEPHPLIDVSDAGRAELPAAIRESARSERLIDLADGDGALDDRSEHHPEVADALRARLDAHLARERAHAPALDLDAESRLRLESLGYGE